MRKILAFLLLASPLAAQPGTGSYSGVKYSHQRAGIAETDFPLDVAQSPANLTGPKMSLKAVDLEITAPVAPSALKTFSLRYTIRKPGEESDTFIHAYGKFQGTGTITVHGSLNGLGPGIAYPMQFDDDATNKFVVMMFQKTGTSYWYLIESDANIRLSGPPG